MTKNRGKTDIEYLSDIVLTPRSSAYKSFCAMATDENGFQSDEAAKKIKDDLIKVLREALTGNIKLLNAKIAEWDKHKARRYKLEIPSTARVKLIPLREKKLEHSLIVHSKKIQLGNEWFFYCEELSDGATAEELIYDLLLRVLKNDELKRFAICKTCQKLFFRKSLKGEYCGNSCRFAANYRHRIENSHIVSGAYIKVEDRR